MDACSPSAPSAGRPPGGRPAPPQVWRSHTKVWLRWEVLSDDSPLAAHGASPAELQERLGAERAGAPSLVLRDGERRQRLVRLDGERLSVGRSDGNDVALPWDTEV